jgi:hypothetical protein
MEHYGVFREADGVALLRPVCACCGEDTNPVFLVAIEDPYRRVRKGELVGAHVVEKRGFTGWNGAGWPDPLGTDEPILEDGDRPVDFGAILEALRGKVWQVPA